MKKKILGLLLFLFALTFGFKINAAVKDVKILIKVNKRLFQYNFEDNKRKISEPTSFGNGGRRLHAGGQCRPCKLYVVWT